MRHHTVTVLNGCGWAQSVTLDLASHFDPKCQSVPAYGKATFTYSHDVASPTKLRSIKRC